MIDLSFIKVEYMLIGMAIVILYFIYYVFTKDTEYHKNIRSVASVVEELNREMFYLKKELIEAKSNMASNDKRMSDEELYAEIERSVYDMVRPLSIGFKRLEETLETMDTKVDIRITSIENGVKQISIPSSVHGNDDEKIISLFQQGVSLETISKELHISKAEVEFVLKINQIK